MPRSPLCLRSPMLFPCSCCVTLCPASRPLQQTWGDAMTWHATMVTCRQVAVAIGANKAIYAPRWQHGCFFEGNGAWHSLAMQRMNASSSTASDLQRAAPRKIQVHKATGGHLTLNVASSTDSPRPKTKSILQVQVDDGRKLPGVVPPQHVLADRCGP